VAVSVDEARSLALSLPEAVEQDHHGRPSFRVGGKIFATLWNDERLNVMLDEGGILTAINAAPDACEEVWWGNASPPSACRSPGWTPRSSASCSPRRGRRKRQEGSWATRT
jgi:hypothetical protein